MDEPLVVAATLLVPLVLGLALRFTGALLAGLALAVTAVVFAVDGSESGAGIAGAALLGGAGGFALGWAGSLSRRLLR